MTSGSFQPRKYQSIQSYLPYSSRFLHTKTISHHKIIIVVSILCKAWSLTEKLWDSRKKASYVLARLLPQTQRRCAARHWTLAAALLSPNWTTNCCAEVCYKHSENYLSFHLYVHLHYFFNTFLDFLRSKSGSFLTILPWFLAQLTEIYLAAEAIWSPGPTHNLLFRHTLCCTNFKHLKR